MWHFLPPDMFDIGRIDEIIKYVPEGIGDASKIFLDIHGEYIMVWKVGLGQKNVQRSLSQQEIRMMKEEMRSMSKEQLNQKKFILMWATNSLDVARMVSKPSFCLTRDNLLMKEFYFINRRMLYNMKDGAEHKIDVTFDWAKNSFSLWKMVGDIKSRYNGSFDEIDFRDPDVLQCLINSPTYIRHHCRDKYDRCIVFPICGERRVDLVKHFLTQENSRNVNVWGNTPLHYACTLQILGLVKEVVKCGGSDAVKMKNNDGEYPLDKCPYSTSIKEFIKHNC